MLHESQVFSTIQSSFSKNVELSFPNSTIYLPACLPASNHIRKRFQMTLYLQEQTHREQISEISLCAYETLANTYYL